VIQRGETVVGLLTGHVLKDPDAILGYHGNTLDGIEAHYPNRLHEAEPSIEALSRILMGEREAVRAMVNVSE
jgi:threonine synthase